MDGVEWINGIAVRAVVVSVDGAVQFVFSQLLLLLLNCGFSFSSVQARNWGRGGDGDDGLILSGCRGLFCRNVIAKRRSEIRI